MSTTDTRIQLTMSSATRDDLWLRARSVPAPDPRASSLLRAVAGQQLVGFPGASQWRLSCDELALAFIREEAPEHARNWPAVFGDVLVPRSHVLALIGDGAPGQRVSGVQFGSDGGVRLEFESGAALLVDGNGAIDWHSSGVAPMEETCSCGHARRWHGQKRGAVAGSGCCEHDEHCPCSGFLP